MKLKNILILIIAMSSLLNLKAQIALDSLIPVRAFCIAAPKPEGLKDFLKFMEVDLQNKKINTLILRVDFNYQYQSHPELMDSDALSSAQVKSIVNLARKLKIHIIPQINLLGHQSWASDLYKLLKVYPQFDETPWIKMPADYKWPNDDNLYCKSYCSLHPDLHKVVFALIDELMNVFEADAFHAGMDEVFYIGEDKCPRCSGRDKSQLFADEVIRIHNHLDQKGYKLWIWGDRLLDGRTTGLGMWEASMNSTWRAIDLIPQDIVICDWHYDKPEPTAAYFALKGFKVITCAWNKPDVAMKQLELLISLRKNSNPVIAGNIYGMAETIWSPAEIFLDYYNGRHTTDANYIKPVNCFNELFERISKLSDK